MKNQKPIKRILVARATPPSSSPYLKLAEKYHVAIDFKPFTSFVSISLPEFRKFKAKILSHTALIFTNKIAVDHFFQLVKNTNMQLPESTKYFCSTEVLANYLQKYIVLRKRKVIKVQGGMVGFFANLKRHKKEKFLIPSSTISRKDIIEFLKEYRCNYTKIVIYKILENNLTQMSVEEYDIIVLFSLLDVRSFVVNFPNFSSKNTQIAVFGTETARAVKQAGLSFDIYAPTPEATSMVDALNVYLRKV